MPQYPPLFPRSIWQTSNAEGVERWREKSATWTNSNPEYKHTILTDDDANAFVHEHFTHRPAIIYFWESLKSIILRADLLRYLVMLAEGGVYSDMDTGNLAPISQVIPSDIDEATVNVVVGIEYDDNVHPLFVRPLSFTQWTLIAKPGHPIFQRAVDRLMSNVEFLARRQRVELPGVHLEMREVLEATGPGMYTDVIMEVLRDQGISVTWDMFHNLKRPSLQGDVLVMPINAFAGNQGHSHSGEPEYGDKFVEHYFGRSWYHIDADGKESTSTEEHSKGE
nr:hypothetical protein LTR18_011121 [Exophiala xenobiotica]